MQSGSPRVLAAVRRVARLRSSLAQQAVLQWPHDSWKTSRSVCGGHIHWSWKLYDCLHGGRDVQSISNNTKVSPGRCVPRDRSARPHEHSLLQCPGT
ncbi:hypothetical protein V5799_023020 [Amblyomma americanum]|uniref:Uncharacterized protein n=1 Tax=Amblyomma americanum TaxID=6943 RepID=A0AAQ4FJG5_AMBAM